MLQFIPMTLDDIKKIRPYFEFAQSRACDNTVGGTFMWRDFFNTEYAVFDSTVIFKVRYLDGQTAFSIPLGFDIKGSLYEIDKYCAENGIPMVLCTATDEDVAVYEKYYEVDVKPEPAWYDYLYLASDLAEMKGRKFNGQRNHINFFNKMHPESRFELITPDNVAEVRRFYEGSGLVDSKDTPVFYEEQNKVFEVLDNYDTYGMTGGFIRVENGQIVAFAIGEAVNDTLFVHIEKASPGERGAYQLIAREFAKLFAGDTVKYVNREEDVGDEGLRSSKLSYHPCEIIRKYTVTVKRAY